ILNRQPPGAGFNYLRSTRLYPEWPFAKLQHTPEKLAEEVVVALLRMGPQDEAARAARIGGWTVPLDYQPVHMLLQELHLGPYAHHPGRITLADLVREHGMAMLVILVFFALLVMVSGYILHLNRRLAAARAELAGQLDKVQCAQESLQASERNYREIFHATNEAIFVHDQSSGAILDVNRAMCSMYGYGRDEVLSLDVGALSAGEPPYTMAEAAGWITRSRDEGPQTFTWRARRKNGELFWVEVNLKHAFIGGRERLLAVVHDITERKKAEDDLARHRLNLEKLVERRTADLRHSEENLAEAQRIAHLGSWEWLIPENVLWWSAEVYRIFDLTPDRFPATYEAFVAAVHPDDQKMVEQAVIDALTKGFPYSIEHRIVLADGRVRTVHERGETTRADDDGRPLKMIGTVQDITERKKAEEEKAVLEAQLIQTQKLEAIGTLAGGIAHDFNNILTVIVGYSELALADAGPENAPLRRDLSQVLQASMRAKDLVAQILAFSRREQVTKQPVIVSSIVKECLKLLRATIPATIEFRSRIEAATGRVWADPVQIHQVLMNLCTNAAHAMRERGGILTVSLTEEGVTATGDGHPPTLAPGRYLRLLVSDTGHGMAADTLGRIFDPFFTTKVKGEGTGMGLAVVHGIVKGCGGEIVVDSVKEEGTSFIVYLPSLAADVVSVEVGPLPAAARGSERILYVEDEAPLAELGKRLLESYGYLVTAETASIKALELFKASPQEFDLVITDQSMPQMSGGRLAEELLMVRPDIPIILCTGYSDEISEESAKAKGIRAFLFKPVKREVLLQKIREVLAPGGQ
ncbi:MAG: PAS domain S-box protein, partial [Desulfobulbaceae bacterium]|nr:PAS domain S-box protein [Desulfobulbaceae bacterium]